MLLLLDPLWQAPDRLQTLVRLFCRGIHRDTRRRAPNRAPAPHANDLIAWGQHFLPHYYQQPPSAMHREVAAILDEIPFSRRQPASGEASNDIAIPARHSPQGGFPAAKLNLLAPRASAKSTLVTLTYVLREALEGHQPYIWIVSDTKRQAMAHLDNIYAELKDNNLLYDKYPRAERLIKTAGRIMLHDVCIEAYGTGQRLRGHRWHEHRPTLIICDDLQNDGHIRSAAARDRSRSWFHGMLTKAGTKRTNIINLGTALHREALAVELHSAPGWTSRRFQAIQEWPTNMHLWAEWEALYRGEGIDPEGVVAISRGLRSAATTPPERDPTHPIDPGGVAAISPGSRSAPGVNDQTESSRPQQGSQRASNTKGAGIPPGCESISCATNRGYRCAQPPANRCDPSGINLSAVPPDHSSHTPHTKISPSPILPFSSSSPQQLARQFFTDHRHEMEAGSALLWPDEEDLYTLMQMRAESGPAVFEREKQCVPMNPEECEWPSSYFGDDIWFSQWPKDLRLKTIALDPSKGTDAKHGDYSAFVMLGIANDNTIYLEANLARRPTPQIVTDGIDLIKAFQPHAFGIETNQFQSLLGGEFITAFREQKIIGLSPWTLDNYLAKQVRIRRLGPLLASRRFKFKTNSPSTKMLLDQLQEFPLTKHDDGPDALEMALRLAESLSQPVPNDGLGNCLVA